MRERICSAHLHTSPSPSRNRPRWTAVASVRPSTDTALNDIGSDICSSFPSGSGVQRAMCMSEMHSRGEQMFVGWKKGGNNVDGVLHSLFLSLFQRLRTRAPPRPPSLPRSFCFFAEKSDLRPPPPPPPPRTIFARSLVGYTENEALPEENSTKEGERANFRNGMERRGRRRNSA